MKKFLSALAALILSAGAVAQSDCTISLSVLRAPQTENIPAQTEEYLVTRLQSALTADGIVAGENLSQFFIAGKFSHVMEDVVPGPPRQFALHTVLTLYIGDAIGENIYATATIDMRGIGNSTERAFINALRTLNANNPTVATCVNNAKKKITAYFDKNYPQILTQADRCAAQHNYDEALWRLSMIPECCAGYAQAEAKTSQYYQRYINQQGTALLSLATAAWSVAHTPEAAAKAFGYLTQIDPESSAYTAAQALAVEMKTSIKSDRNFELRQKYSDAVDIKRRQIEAAREVGVAYGKGQQPQTTNLTWLK
ncbi:MAG: hypothetical protein K2M40_08820 [Muribaculaceae bacterium]|nr:hypothetical protein [Muribaculaceae bacterium]